VLALPATASATLYGFESNAELVNGNRSLEQRTETIAGMSNAGAQVLRINVGWNEVAGGCAGQSPAALKNNNNSCYDWRVFDQVVDLARDRKLQVLASVSRAPVWLHGRTDSSFLGNSNKQWVYSVSHYSSFMFAAARRYRAGSSYGHVRLWTVWNEPNSDVYLSPQKSLFQQRRTAARYAQLLGRTSVQIKKANRFALVAAGPTGPSGGSKGTPPITFLARVQANLPRFLPGAGLFERRWIDAWAHNPYPGATIAPSKGKIKAPKVGMTNIRDLFTQLDRSPITRRKPVWATEFSYESNPPDPQYGISQYLQGRFMAESFDWLDRTKRVPIAIWYGYRDGDDIVNDWQSGVLFNDGRRKQAFYWFQRPIALNTSSVRRGQSVRVFARSAVSPRSTRIAWSENGRTWRILPAKGRRRDGSQVQSVRVYRKTWFATWDGKRGPMRVVNVRR
jgi:hypothetical protein